MKLQYKVVLYSVLIFPGAGYFLLGSRLRGWLCVALTLVCLSFVMFEANYKSKIIVHQINAGALSTNIPAIANALKNTPSPLMMWQQWLVYGSLIVTWGLAIFDGYRLASKRSLKQCAATITHRL